MTAIIPSTDQDGKGAPVTCLFLDIGGVLLTDGWDRHARERAAANFDLELVEMEKRHHSAWDTYQEGKLTLEEYMGRVIFHRKRTFSGDEFRCFMFAQSSPYPEMINLIIELKRQHGLKIAVVSNEGRELNTYRVQTFLQSGLIDSFISSSFVHLLKPDPDIYRLALDIAQVPAEQVVYIEDTPMFVEVAEGLGIRSILHRDYQSTRAQLTALGLPMSVETLPHAS